MNLGLTGGIACGKSTVAELLVRRGAILIDADRLAREVVEPGSPTLEEVVRQFGQAVLKEDGSLDRKRLGEIVFTNPGLRKRLEGILHPPIRQIIKERMADAEQSHPGRLVVVDIPLLYESGMEHLVSEIMVVYIPKELQLERLINRDLLTREQAEQRLNAQMPIEDKKLLADIVIDNSGGIEQTERQVDEFLRSKGLL